MRGRYIHLTSSGDVPGAGAGQGISVAVLTAVYRITPSNRSPGYCVRRPLRPAVSHEGGGGGTWGGCPGGGGGGASTRPICPTGTGVVGGWIVWLWELGVEGGPIEPGGTTGVGAAGVAGARGAGGSGG